jgi:fumarylacetoacetase
VDASDQAAGALDIDLEVCLLTEGLASKGLPPHRLSVGNARHLYWTAAQLVTHHSCGGCNLRPGDLFGTGTISGSGEGELGSLLEISAGGRRPVVLASGETRRFLEDGDTVIMRARCHREGFAGIGFGECQGTVVAAARTVSRNTRGR